MTKHFPNLHHMDELNNFAANNLFRLVIEVAHWDPCKLVSHVLGSCASKRGTVITKQVQLGIGGKGSTVGW